MARTRWIFWIAVVASGCSIRGIATKSLADTFSGSGVLIITYLPQVTTGVLAIFGVT